jgi:hypothetical protein
MESTFAANPDVNILYVFEDGNAFIYKPHADGHAKTIGKSYSIVKREEVETKTKKTTK